MAGISEYMQRQTIIPGYSAEVQSLTWIQGKLVDFVQGTGYSPETNRPFECGYRFSYPFDAAIVSDDGTYAVIYQRLGTKGILLKQGKILREINRSYYHAYMYEYPVAFFRAASGVLYLIHCPFAYHQLDFEDVETGEIASHIPARQPTDFFHSRLEVSPGHKALLSKGWLWHPVDMVAYFDLEACLANPLLLDRQQNPPSLDYEVSTASFITDELILLGVRDDAEYFEEDADNAGIRKSQIAIWDTQHNSLVDTLVLNYKIANLMVVDNLQAIDLYQFPKLINIKTGELIAQFSDIDSGAQNSSIIGHLKTRLPMIAWDRQARRLAIGVADKIEILML